MRLVISTTYSDLRKVEVCLYVKEGLTHFFQIYCIKILETTFAGGQTNFSQT